MLLKILRFISETLFLIIHIYQIDVTSSGTPTITLVPVKIGSYSAESKQQNMRKREAYLYNWWLF